MIPCSAKNFNIHPFEYFRIYQNYKFRHIFLCGEIFASNILAL